MHPDNCYIILFYLLCSDLNIFVAQMYFIYLFIY